MKKKAILLSILAIILLMVFIIYGTGKTGGSNAMDDHVEESTIIAMDTVMTIKAYGSNAFQGIAAATEEIYRLENLLSTTKEGSEVYRINHANGEAVQVSDETTYLIKEAINISSQTGGALDITIYPIVKCWGFTGDEFRVPEDSEIQVLLNDVGYDRVVCSDGFVKLAKGQMIDLGAVAKGYAADRVKLKLSEAGVENAIINLGGNVLTMGTKPDGEKWSVGIKNPFSTSELTGAVSIDAKAVVTSGNYERYFEKEGKRYWHILDPQTGYPADAGVVSVTIVTDSSFLADALSTAVYVMGPEKTRELYEKRGDFEYILITNNGETIMSENISFIR